MQGVEILTSAQVATEWAFNWPVFWITFGTILGVCLIAGIWATVTDECEWTVIPTLFFVGIMLGGVFGSGLGDAAKNPTAYETQYKVTISDQVPITEFLEHYEVIEQDGKIFTVREKTND